MSISTNNLSCIKREFRDDGESDEVKSCAFNALCAKFNYMRTLASHPSHVVFRHPCRCKRCRSLEDGPKGRLSPPRTRNGRYFIGHLIGDLHLDGEPSVVPALQFKTTQDL